MIEIKLAETEQIIAFCEKHGIDYRCGMMLYSAGEEYFDPACLFTSNGVTEAKIIALFAGEPPMLPIADGVLRATVNYLLNHEYKKVIYKGSECVKLFERLGFKEKNRNFSLDLDENVFKGCI